MHRLDIGNTVNDLINNFDVYCFENIGKSSCFAKLDKLSVQGNTNLSCDTKTTITYFWNIE